MEIDHGKKLAVIDKWIRVSGHLKTVVLLRGLAEQLQKILQMKIENPDADVTLYGGVVIDSISQILRQESADPSKD